MENDSTVLSVLVDAFKAAAVSIGLHTVIVAVDSNGGVYQGAYWLAEPPTYGLAEERARAAIGLGHPDVARYRYGSWHVVQNDVLVGGVGVSFHPYKEGRPDNTCVQDLFAALERLSDGCVLRSTDTGGALSDAAA